MIKHKSADDDASLRLTLETTGIGIWEWQIATNTLVWSDALKRIYNLKPSTKITYEKYQSMLHIDDSKKMNAAIQKTLESGEPYCVEHRIVWNDGTVHWVMAQGRAFLKNGKPYCMMGTATIIDDRIATEKQLHETEDRFRIMADTAPVLIWMSDANKKYMYFNKMWLDFTGLKIDTDNSPEQAKRIYPDDLRHYIDTYNKAYKEQKPFSIEYRLRRHDGVYRWLLDNGAPRFSDEGEFLGYIGSCTDIENIKRISKRSDELETQNDMLEIRYDELMALNQSKDEFISLASHQLRTPATGVKQYISMLLEGYAGTITSEQRAMLKTAFTSNERQLSIINDLLRVAHIDSGKVILKKQKTDLVLLTKDILNEQRSKFKKRDQQVATSFSSNKIIANIDSDRLRMAIENIVDNASKYTPNKKSISVSIEESEDRVSIIIKDKGVGIAKADVTKLFKKFSRIHNPLSLQVSGTGLGLYWADKIVQLHGGRIGIASKLHSGTTFSIELPKI